jgi:hypothetical protein
MHQKEIEQEAYFLSEADDFKESAEYYWCLASEVITRSYDTPSQIIDRVNKNYDENGMPRSMAFYHESQRKTRIINQRFVKHPNPDLKTRLEINSNIMLQHISKRWTEEGDKEFMDGLIKDLGNIEDNIMK